MNKVKLLVLTALAGATVSVSALAAAPLASAATAKPATAAVSSAERPRICFVFGPWKYCI